MKLNTQFAIALFLLISSAYQAQTATGQSSEFIPGDENYTLMLAFHRTDTILVVTPDGFDLDSADRELIEAFPFWGGHQKIPHYRYLNEKDLEPHDYRKRIQYYGPFFMFRELSGSAIPFKKLSDGFGLGENIFNDPGDAFCYLSSDTLRFYTCSNSGQGFTLYRTYMAGYYQLYIFRGDDMVVTGFSDFNGEDSRLNCLPSLRAEYFLPWHSRYFDFEIASSLNTDSLGVIISREADDFADTLFSRLGAKGSVRGRILTYIYANRADLQKFIAAPSWTTVYGKAAGNMNHLSSFDVALFRHEAAHSLIEQIAGHNPYCFFSEGFAVSTEYFFTPGSFKNDRKVARENTSLLSEEMVYSTTGRFYNNPASYQVSGAFTRYLVDRLGMEKFIRAYGDNKIEDALKEETGLDIAQTIKSFMQSLEEGED